MNFNGKQADNTRLLMCFLANRGLVKVKDGIDKRSNAFKLKSIIEDAVTPVQFRYPQSDGSIQMITSICRTKVRLKHLEFKRVQASLFWVFSRLNNQRMSHAAFPLLYSILNDTDTEYARMAERRVNADVIDADLEQVFQDMAYGPEEGVAF